MKPTIQQLKNNPYNRIFFENATFHQDKIYQIREKKGEYILEVTTGHGVARYKLHNKDIEEYISE